MGQRSSRRRVARKSNESKATPQDRSTAIDALVTHLQDIDRYYADSKGLHNDVDVLLAATSDYPFALPKSWRDRGRASVTHKHLIEVWKEAFELHGVKGPPRTFMGSNMFEGLITRYLKSARGSTDQLIDNAIRYGIEATREIIEHSIELNKATAPQIYLLSEYTWTLEIPSI